MGNIGFVYIVSQKHTYVIERLGKFLLLASPGLKFKIPLFDKIAYRHTLKQDCNSGLSAIDIQKQNAITKDNVSINIDGLLFMKINDPFKASYSIEKPSSSLRLLAQTVMRTEIGKLKLDQIFQQRNKLNLAIHQAVNNVSQDWGIQCLRYQILNIDPPEEIKISMQLQAEAQRSKRRDILISEGDRQAKVIYFNQINLQQGKKQSAILQAQGRAQSIKLLAVKQKQALDILKNALCNKDIKNYILMNKYLEEYGKVMKSSQVIIAPEGKDANMLMYAALLSNRRIESTKQTKQPSPQPPKVVKGQQSPKTTKFQDSPQLYSTQ